MQITSQSVYRPLKVDRKKQNSEAESDSEFQGSLEAIDGKPRQDENRQGKSRSRPDPEHKIDVQA